MNSVASSPYYRGETEAQRGELVCSQSTQPGRHGKRGMGSGAWGSESTPNSWDPEAKVAKDGLLASFP